MPRPPAGPNDTLVDANVCARAASTIERGFSAADLPRLSVAGIRADARIEARLAFSLFDSAPTVHGELRGRVTLTCQRCMQAVPVRLDEDFRVLIVAEERADEPGGYEPVVADAARLDVRWLVEEQVLLALPLVPMHEGDECNAAAPPPPSPDEAAARQQPFHNLRDLLRRR